MMASQDAPTFKPFFFFYLTSCKTAERRGGRLARAAGGARDEEGRLEVLGGWGGSDRQTDRQTGSPPAVPEQCSLRWNGDVAKNNISQQQAGLLPLTSQQRISLSCVRLSPWQMEVPDRPPNATQKATREHRERPETNTN